jgi:hypothetical protein
VGSGEQFISGIRWKHKPTRTRMCACQCCPGGPGRGGHNKLTKRESDYQIIYIRSNSDPHLFLRTNGFFFFDFISSVPNIYLWAHGKVPDPTGMQSIHVPTPDDRVAQNDMISCISIFPPLLGDKHTYVITIFCPANQSGERGSVVGHSILAVETERSPY